MTKATGSLTEVMLIAHFAGPINLTVLDLANWIEANKEYDLPPQQTPSVAPLNLSGQQTVQVFVGAPNDGVSLPRLVLRSSKTPFVLQMQQDRFGLSWTRQNAIGHSVPYPGFETVLREFEQVFKSFEQWHQGRFGSTFQISILELGYHNALPPETPDGRVRRLSDVFKFVVPTARKRLHGFQVQWLELSETREPLPQVSALAGIGAIQQYPSASLVPVIFFNFTGLGQMNVGADSAAPQINEVANLIHNHILEVYEASIVPF